MKSNILFQLSVFIYHKAKIRIVKPTEFPNAISLTNVGNKGNEACVSGVSDGVRRFRITRNLDGNSTVIIFGTTRTPTAVIFVNKNECGDYLNVQPLLNHSVRN